MAGDDIARGLMTAAAEEASEEDVPADPAQMPLFPSDRLGDLAGTTVERIAQYKEPRGRGRPPGARNRSTTQWMGYLHSRYPSPLITLAEVRCRPTRQLAEELGCKMADAAALQVRCADIEAPYWHSKQPIGVRIQEERPVLIMADPEEWLARWEKDHPSGDTLDLSALRVRSADAVDVVEDGADRAMDALLQREQGGNAAGTSGQSGARMPQGDANQLKSHTSHGIISPMLPAVEGDDDAD